MQIGWSMLITRGWQDGVIPVAMIRIQILYSNLSNNKYTCSKRTCPGKMMTGGVFANLQNNWFFNRKCNIYISIFKFNEVL